MRKVLIHEGIFTTISGTDQHAASERIRLEADPASPRSVNIRGAWGLATTAL